jgi:hypothetical protein
VNKNETVPEIGFKELEAATWNVSAARPSSHSENNIAIKHDHLNFEPPPNFDFSQLKEEG